MTDRAANDTLLGYFYQFDKTIFELLKLPTVASSLQVEGIEDIDLINPADIDVIQCKYYHGQKYAPSKFQDALLPMLVDFKNNSAKRKCYRLYAHFGDFNGMPATLDAAAIKAILTLTPRKGANKGVPQLLYQQAGVSNAEIDAFSKLLVIEEALDFDAQHGDVIAALQSQFRCDPTDAESFYYSAALKFVFSVATLKTIAERTVTKQKFVKEIDKKEITFSRWLRSFLGREKYIALMQKQLKRKGYLRSQSTKAVLLGKRYFQGSSTSFTHFVNVLIDRFYSKGKHLWDATPWTVIVDLDIASVKDIKRCLLKADIFFTDGYEHVDFTPSAFDRKPIKTLFRSERSKRSSDLLGDSSFVLRLVTADSWKAKRTSLQPIDVFFCDSDVTVSDYVGRSTQVARIDGLETFKDFIDLLPS
jgi:hypothetical protein